MTSSVEKVKEVKPLEFLGRQAAQFGIEPRSLESRLNGESPEEVTGIMRGYVEQLREMGVHAKVYELLQEGWLKFMFPDRAEIEKEAMIGILSEKHDKDRDGTELQERLVNHLVEKGHKRRTEIVRAVEDTRPDMALWIYSRLENTDAIAAFAERTFETDRAAAWKIIKDDQRYNETRIGLVEGLLGPEDIGQEEYEFGAEALDNLHWWVSHRFDKALAARISACAQTIIDATIESAPAIAYKSLERVRNTMDAEKIPTIFRAIADNALKKGDPVTASGAAGSAEFKEGEEEAAIALYNRIVESGLEHDEPMTAYWVLEAVHKLQGEVDHARLDKVLDAVMAKDPFEAFDLAKRQYKEDRPEVYRRVRTNLIESEGLENTDAVLAKFNAAGSSEEKAGCEELGKHLYGHAQSEEDIMKKSHLYTRARSLFQRAGYDGKETLDCAKQLLLFGDKMDALHIDDEKERVPLGLTIAEELEGKEARLQLASKAFWLLYHSEDAEQHKETIGKLSQPLEEAGEIGKAYQAAILAGDADEERLDRLRRAMVRKEREDYEILSPSLPHAMGKDDMRGREIFYEMTQAKMKTSQRYEFCLATSRMTDEQVWHDRVTALRQECVDKDIKASSHLFRNNNDQAGIDLVEEKLREQAPGFEEHAELARRVLKLYVKEAAE